MPMMDAQVLNFLKTKRKNYQNFAKNNRDKKVEIQKIYKLSIDSPLNSCCQTALRPGNIFIYRKRRDQQSKLAMTAGLMAESGKNRQMDLC